MNKKNHSKKIKSFFRVFAIIIEFKLYFFLFQLNDPAQIGNRA